MKTLFTTVIIITIFILRTNGQTLINSDVEGLSFSKALFISMNSDKLRDYIAIDTTIIIEKGKVWSITSAKAFMVANDQTPFENEISLMINNQIIYYYKSTFDTPVWLPEGQYRVRLMSRLKDKNLDFIAYISGVEFSIK